MKRIFALLIFVISTVAVYAQSDTSHAQIQPNTSLLTVQPSSSSAAWLMVFSLLGIAIHWFVDLRKAQSQSVDINIKHYAASTWVSSTTSLLMCVAFILLRNEIYSRMPVVMGVEGLCCVALGYAGDSALPLIFGFAKPKLLNINTDKKDT